MATKSTKKRKHEADGTEYTDDLRSERTNLDQAILNSLGAPSVREFRAIRGEKSGFKAIEFLCLFVFFVAIPPFNSFTA